MRDPLGQPWGVWLHCGVGAPVDRFLLDRGAVQIVGFSAFRPRTAGSVALLPLRGR